MTAEVSEGRRVEVIQDVTTVSFGPVTIDFGVYNQEQAWQFAQMLLAQDLVITVDGERLVTQVAQPHPIDERMWRRAKPVEPVVVEVWPAEATEERPWHDKLLRIDLGEPEKVRVRSVRLRGQELLMNDAGEAWCEDCHQFLTMRELAAPDNGHRIAIRLGPGETIELPQDMRHGVSRAAQSPEVIDDVPRAPGSPVMRGF